MLEQPPAAAGTDGRGKFWEASYLPKLPQLTPWQIDESDPTAFAARFKTATGLRHCEISGAAQAANVRNGNFDECEFIHFKLEKGSFTNFDFLRCRFVSATFEAVKFSKCTFKETHFLHVNFHSCVFIDCRFEKISASAEHLHFIQTSIPAENFIKSLSTNIEALPSTHTAEHQQHRLQKDKANMSWKLLSSNERNGDIDLHSEAVREFMLRDIDWRITNATYRTRKNSQGVYVREKQRGAKCQFSQLRYRFDKAFIVMAGLITDWGRSPARAFGGLFATILAFATLYASLNARGGWVDFFNNLPDALIKSFSNTLVFGYSVYAISPHSSIDAAIMALNAGIGLLWYSLVIGALAQRVIR